MQKDHLLFQSWAISIVASFTLIDLILTANPLLAQITPDETLGGERSTVTREVIRGINGDRISGGARRGQNLFHSFQQFDVNEGLGAYFDNPADVQRIFSRVTGSDRSEILGTLGVLGNADLFFINPNGILFGPNSTLDLGGSFAATTANGIQFGDQGFFSATTPELPSPLLTVNPSAFLFNQVPIGNIANQSIAPNGTTPDGSPAFGLRVPDGESLLLLGGDIEMDGGRLNAFGGRIELGGLAGVGTVGLNQTGDILSLSFLPNSVLADVTLVNDARVAVRGSGGGDIIVNADEFTATNGGRLVAGVETAGDGGNILINADQVNLAGVGLSGIASGIYQEIFPNATGSTGNINVNTRSLQMQSGAEISTTTYGAGDAGEVSVTADTIELVGLDSNISSGTDGDSTGNGGDVTVSSQVLQLRDGAKTSARTYGSGQGGNLSVTATEQAELSGSAINAQGGVFVSGLFATTSGTGNAGSLQFEGGQLQIRDGALVSAATYGAGDAGDISVTADTIELVGMDTTRKFRSGIRGGTDTDSTGNGGDVTVSSRVLQVQDGAAISVIT
ncbi:MAG TPA: filamentous hemagglutinin N-terminal domain-containing protein, partial [Allocoleopsis sp.]